MSMTKNAAISDIDALLNASMTDLDDLPPVGIPPSGVYTLEVKAELKQEPGKHPRFVFTYKVLDILELKDPDTAGEVAVNQQFNVNFSPFKKDGTANEWGIAFLKEATAPFAAHFGTTSVGDTVAQIQGVTCTATLTRKQKKNSDEVNVSLSDVTIL